MTLTDKQKDLLEQLNNIVISIAGEAERDNDFNEFIATLGIFKIDLMEASTVLFDNMEDCF